jgi:hypothetical protein
MSANIFSLPPPTWAAGGDGPTTSTGQTVHDAGITQTSTVGSGLRKGVNLGKGLLNEKSNLRGKVNVPTVHPGEGTFPFPVAPYNDEEANLRERVSVMKDYVVGAQLPNNIHIPMTVDTQELIRINEEKKGAVERLHFYQWLYNLMGKYEFSPDIVNYVKQLYPEYFEEQIALIENNLELQKRAAMLAVKVIPDSREDLEFLWAVNTGQIKLPTHVAYQKGSDSDDSANFSRGLLSVKNNEMPSNTATDTMFNVMGKKNAPFVDLVSMAKAGEHQIPKGLWWK